MRYRRLSYRYEILMTPSVGWPPTSHWQADALRNVIGRPHWRPPVDVYESSDALTVVVELAGVDVEALEALLYEDALVVEGERRQPCCDDDAVYRRAEIRQGRFRLELPIDVAVDSEAVESRYDSGFLYVKLPKRQAR
jgi:HSP20 family protein